ncbi:hypothetical protein RUM43_009270 [Polyplax serrata]|uniref:Uncharacterized protein n=1 Tax=Polyplax serrata TaxID=468196 RepID=A0AAN8S205_POLSC
MTRQSDSQMLKIRVNGSGKKGERAKYERERVKEIEMNKKKKRSKWKERGNKKRKTHDEDDTIAYRRLQHKPFKRPDDTMTRTRGTTQVQDSCWKQKGNESDKKLLKRTGRNKKKDNNKKKQSGPGDEEQQCEGRKQTTHEKQQTNGSLDEIHEPAEGKKMETGECKTNDGQIAKKFSCHGAVSPEEQFPVTTNEPEETQKSDLGVWPIGGSRDGFGGFAAVDTILLFLCRGRRMIHFVLHSPRGLATINLPAFTEQKKKQRVQSTPVDSSLNLSRRSQVDIIYAPCTRPYSSSL